ncbi:hypothetical protein [Streptomyces parvus]|uniref:hypothetical protein n=1 Tax=Streptomyces parvus TaxID=66428 RepID=UPI0021019153|nr:hypothetical protein [Streptomyces parvus]MCQ1577180.1 hypothetical protein [Streptomyces parvus]
MKFEDGTQLRLRAPEQHGPTAIGLLPGLGAHRLAVRLEAEPLSVADGVNHATIAGELRAAEGIGWIGSFLPTQVPLRTKAHTVAVDLVVPVTSAQLLALEEHRAGADLAVLLDLDGTLPQSTAHPFAHVQETRRLAASSWEQQLESVGLAASFTITVPLPMAHGPLRQAAEHLSAADRQITAGEYPDAIRETRLALGAMRSLGVWPSGRAKKRDEQGQADRYGSLLDRIAVQAEGYAEVIQAAFNQASGPQHNDGAIAGAAWTRADAVALNAMTAALLHRLASEMS